MPRLNVEEEWWTDERRFELAKELGSETLADGVAIAAWRLAQKYWGNGRRPIPLFEFEKLPHKDALLKTKLAVRRGQAFYIRGSSIFHEWYAARKDAAHKGGKSLKIRPKQTESKRVSKREASGRPSYLSSLSSSSIQNTNTLSTAKIAACVSSGDLEKVYDEYPLKKGKTRGLQKLAKEIKTRDDLDAVIGAIRRYKTTDEVQRGFIKHFSTFAGEWRDWATAEAGTVTGVDVTTGVNWRKVFGDEQN